MRVPAGERHLGERYAHLDQTTGQQTAAAKRTAAVWLAPGGRLQRQIECLRFLRLHQRDGSLIGGAMVLASRRLVVAEECAFHLLENAGAGVELSWRDV